MGSCYAGDHMAEDPIQTGITTCNNEEPNHKFLLEWSVKDYWVEGGRRGGGGCLNMFYWAQTSPHASAVVQNIWPALR